MKLRNKKKKEMYNTKKEEKKKKKIFYSGFAVLSDLIYLLDKFRRLDYNLYMTISIHNSAMNYHLSLILFADERRRFDDDERDRFLRSLGTELCRFCARALGLRRPIFIFTRPCGSV